MTVGLEVENLSKKFGELHVFDGISLRVAERGVHTIIGPNGAGKTTLFNCVTGVLHPDTGAVRLAGQDITSSSMVARVRKGLVRTFQISRVFDGLSVFENVRLPLQKEHLGGRPGLFIARRQRRLIEERCGELLAEVGIDSTMYDLPAGSLSYPSRRMLEVAIALACNPTVLCLDEPTAGLGIGEADSLATLIGRLGERLAVLLVEHRMSIVHRVSDDVTVLAYGSIIAQGTPEAVAADQHVQDVYLGRDRGRLPSPTRAARTPDRQTPARDLDDSLVLSNVNSFYGSSHVLHDVSLTARQGQVTCVLGRNGAGKTTTLGSIMGAVHVRSGSIRFGPHELRKLPTHKIAQLGITLVPEQRWIFPDLTVEENIQIAGGKHPHLLEEAYEEFPALREHRKSKGSHLSGGQQQMLALARALVRQSHVILLDEPTQGLSPMYIEMVLQHVLRLRDRGVTVILVEQALDFVAAVADTVYLLSDGSLQAQLDPTELDENDELLSKHLHAQSHT